MCHEEELKVAGHYVLLVFLRSLEFEGVTAQVAFELSITDCEIHGLARVSYIFEAT